MNRQDSLKRRVLDAASRHPVPERKAHRSPAAAAALAAVAMLLVYATMHAAGALPAPGEPARGLPAVSSAMVRLIRLGTATSGRPEGIGGLVVAGTVALAAAATLLALPRRRSMLSPARRQLLAVAIGVPLLTGAWLVLWGTTYVDPYARTGLRCLALTGATAPWPFVALYVLSRRLDPRHPALTGAALGSAAGAWGAVMAEIWCPIADGAHVLVGHVLPLVGVAAVGAALGYGLFRLRRVSASRPAA